MLHTVLKSKIHCAYVTEANLNYVGSCTIDQDLLDAANMSDNEQIHMMNVTNGQRFITYILPGERGSGVICLNGACARLAAIGDKVIIITYGIVDDKELENNIPTIVFPNRDNKLE